MQDLDDGERRLLAAVLLRATKDARRGSGLALAWLSDDGAVLADDLGIAHQEVIRAQAEAWRPPKRVDHELERLGALVATIEGTGLDRLKMLMTERPGVTNAEAAEVLHLSRKTVKNYRCVLKSRARGDLLQMKEGP